MLVQDRPLPKPSKSDAAAAMNNHHRRFSGPPKNLEFSAWASDNLYKILAVLFLIATVAGLFFLRGASGDSAVLLCLDHRHPLRPSKDSLDRIPLPRIAWDSVPPLRPDDPSSDPFSSFRHPRWIVVSADSDSSSVAPLSRIKGWQLLTVANSETPPDWSLKGAIHLSLEQQSRLGFRVTAHLPYGSHVRKAVGYLYAVRHGARAIYDADERVEVIGADLESRFDVDLVGERARKEPLLQYSHENPNRTVVNPYIHFGQRSVWPRGLPLEDVGEFSHEEFYTEIHSGRQFIQQGLSNGLPDVDSVFYFTRKSKLEAFDIRFDEGAQVVALPQGMMVPVNSFNTLFHYQAFWGLMLPVSVSSMASDILRGYWAQRLLWEIGGYVAVYPPTVHRVDRVQSYPFAEEKDLHVNVGRLIKFLVSWRSKKPTLFERVLELSHAMAEEGFWGEQDLRFTADWLQDLLAVGYRQPRLMSLELDRPRATIGHGDRREFVPRRLPSVHLGVEETGTVSTEIGNLVRWRKHFGNVVLILYCSGPADRTALEWRLLYGRVFKTVVILSEQKDVDLAVEYGQLWQAYKYLPKVFDRYKSAEGFVFLQDDMILNYWNLLQADKTKLWITNKVSSSWMPTTIDANSSEWFQKHSKMVKKVVRSMPVHFQVTYKENIGEKQKLTLCGSEVFYVPQRHVIDFADLVSLVGDLEMHQKIAVPLFFLAMDSPSNYDSSALGSMIYVTDSSSNNSSSFYSAEVPAVYPWSIRSESDFVKLVRAMATGDPLLMDLV
ncbi:hypothetical protein QJS10_CPA05g00845 [Acorus calamus]|uniref:Glycosyltransferase STELLO2 n=1 Tax=Acorus calamus TaxID=4465 RepID=A0AAV9ETM5_ACOCL|nr:hypothetical protein QJS10_CPA05g00845 [Acorus calamus]